MSQASVVIKHREGVNSFELDGLDITDNIRQCRITWVYKDNLAYPIIELELTPGTELIFEGHDVVLTKMSDG